MALLEVVAGSLALVMGVYSLVQWVLDSYRKEMIRRSAAVGVGNIALGLFLVGLGLEWRGAAGAAAILVAAVVAVLCGVVVIVKSVRGREY